jgi:hypothetical protein
LFSDETVVWAWASVDAPKPTRTANNTADIFTGRLLEKLERPSIKLREYQYCAFWHIVRRSSEPRRIDLLYGYVGPMWLQISSEATAKVRVIGRSTMIWQDVRYQMGELSSGANLEIVLKLDPPR